MRVNTAKKSKTKTVAPVVELTHGGAEASFLKDAEKLLRRSVMSCMLWEGEFYEDGASIAKRIEEGTKKLSFDAVAKIAIEAREDMKLRHVPLLLASALASRAAGRKMGDLLERIIQRPDEMGEFLSIYWRNGKKPLAKQVKVGLARAFRKFNEYSLAKYDRATDAVKLRDVLFLTHAKPADKKQEKLWKKLVEGKLATPDTWETQLSAGADKKKTFERLMSEEKLGAMAFLRNLRNMFLAGVDKKVVRDYGLTLDYGRVLPFRFIAAARAVPQWEDIVEQFMFKALENTPKLSGKTVVVIDTSGSMHGGAISGKSELSRVDAAKALAIIIKELGEDVVVYATAGNDGTRIHATMSLPARRGFALGDSIFSPEVQRKIGGGGIFLKQCMDYIYDKEKSADRVIVLTDEQDCDYKCKPDTANAFGKRNYLINVASYKNGIGYKNFVHVEGFSEAVVDYIRMLESMDV